MSARRVRTLICSLMGEILDVSKRQAQYLPQKAACVENRKDGERRSDQACNEFLLIYGNNLPSNFVKSMV